MRAWWIAILWMPFASATPLWVDQRDTVSALLAPGVAQALAEPLGQPLTIQWADEPKTLKRQVAQTQSLGWGEVSSSAAALVELKTGWVSRQDFPVDQLTGRIGRPEGSQWATQLSTQTPDATWFSYPSTEQGLLRVIDGEIDAYVDTLANLSAAMTRLQLHGLRLSTGHSTMAMGLFSAPDFPDKAKLSRAVASLKPVVKQRIDAQFRLETPVSTAHWPWGVAAALGWLWLITLILWRRDRQAPARPVQMARPSQPAATPKVQPTEARGPAYLNEVNQLLQKEIAKRQAKEAELLTVQDALNQAHRRLEQQVRTDGLTQLANRRHFDEQLNKEWRRHAREAQMLTIVLMDIDYFKKYNDGLGHPAGDACLKQVATLLHQAFNRSGDLVARYGGEEFVVLLANSSAQDAAHQVERLQSLMNQAAIPHPGSDVSPQVTLSMGIASCIPLADDDPWGLVEEADQALYQAKVDGRNQYRVVAA